MVREWNCAWPLLVFVNWYKLDFVRFRKWNKLSTVTWSQSLALQKKTRCSIKVWEKRVTAPLIYLQSRLHGSHGDHPPANIPDVLQNSNLRQMKLTINHHTHLGLTEVADRAPSRFPPLRWFHAIQGHKREILKCHRVFRFSSPYQKSWLRTNNDRRLHLQIVEKIACKRLIALLLSVIEQEHFKCPIIYIFLHFLLLLLL